MAHDSVCASSVCFRPQERVAKQGRNMLQNQTTYITSQEGDRAAREDHDPTISFEGDSPNHLRTRKSPSPSSTTLWTKPLIMRLFQDTVTQTILDDTCITERKKYKIDGNFNSYGSKSFVCYNVSFLQIHL